MKSLDSLLKVESYINNVGKSERTKCVIEPKLSEQWFLKMEEISKPALKAVMTMRLNFFLKNLKIRIEIGWKISGIGIFLDSFGGGIKFRFIIMEKITRIMLLLKWINKALEKAQQKVEARNFDS